MLHFLEIQTHNANGAPQNRKPIVFLHSHTMELLPPRSWSHSMQWRQTTGKISQLENPNNKVNRWGLELATYNITFEWISGAHNKAADCSSQLVELPHDRLATIQMLSAINLDRPAFNTRSRTAQHGSTENPTSQPLSDAVMPDVTDTTGTTPKSLTTDRLQALLQMQKTDPFCKCISKWLSNEKAPKHEADLFLHVQGLLYKHVTDLNKKFWALVIPKAWKYTVLVEAHDKHGHQGVTQTYCLIKHQYY